MEFSWDFRGSESLRSKHLLTLGQFSWVCRGVFVDPLKTRLVAKSGGFRGLFVDVGAPPAIENTRKPTALVCLFWLVVWWPESRLTKEQASENTEANKTHLSSLKHI